MVEAGLVALWKEILDSPPDKVKIKQIIQLGGTFPDVERVFVDEMIKQGLLQKLDEK